MSEKSPESIRVWDLPVRIFHWSLTLLVGVCIYTGITGGFKEMDYHMLSGYGVLTLILFRFAWGFIGSTHARFRNFLAPGAVFPYLRRLFTEDYQATTGHNPLGALSVIAILLALGVQAGTGLFANDDIFLEGPLAYLVSDETSDRLTGIHHLNSKLIFGLLGLHVAAIAFHELVKRERLILPMVTGRKQQLQAEPAGTGFGLMKEIAAGAVTMGLAGGFVYWLVNYL